MPTRPSPEARGCCPWRRPIGAALALLAAAVSLDPGAVAQTTDTEAAPADDTPVLEIIGTPETSGEPQATVNPDSVLDPVVVGAVLQGLDKITARISTFDAPLDEPVRFGSLEIVARTCHKTPPEEPPERAAFLEVVDVRPDSPAVPLFTGWMFASSPALSALEHPVYDVWVIDCRKSSTPDSEVSEGN